MHPRDEILEQAMRLSAADQAYLAYAIERHLTDQIPDAVPVEDAPEAQAFLIELQRRSAAYRLGKGAARDAETVIAGLRSRQTQETLQ